MLTNADSKPAPSPVRRAIRLSLYALLALFLAALLAFGVFYYRALNPPLPPPLAEVSQVTVGTLPIDVTTSLSNVRPQPTPLATMIRPRLPTLIGLWASWCAPCREEARVLARLRQDWPADKVNIVYLNIDRPDQFDVARAFLIATGAQALGLHPIDGATMNRVTGQTAVALPRIYLFDRSGTPLRVLTGFVPGEADRLLDRWAKQLPLD